MKNSRQSLLQLRVLIFVSAMSVTVFEGLSQSASESKKTTAGTRRSHDGHDDSKPVPKFNYQPSKDLQQISFETLGAFQIKVDWVMNLTNSAADSLKRDGEIPARVKALDGKRVSIAGFMKPIKQEEGGATEFLLVKEYSTCCEGKLPKINELIHVRTTGKAIPLAGEKMFAVRGLLQVGEKLGTGNIVSIYRLEGAELEIVDSRRDRR